MNSHNSYRNNLYLQIFDALQYSVEGSVESSLPIHVLPVSPLDGHVDFTVIISSHFLVLGGGESGDAHDLHHLNLLAGLSFKVFLSK